MRWTAAVAALAVAVTIGIVVFQRGRAGGGPRLGITAVRAPSGTRIRVQVLNATRTRGLARRATMHLRDRGFDVVEMGTDQTPLDSTLVLDRSGHPEWAQLVARALGDGRVLARPDSSRYLDVTVLLGASWRPPAEPFYP
jgi:hypothetical protein